MYIENIENFDSMKAIEAIKSKEEIEFKEKVIVLASKSVSRKRIMQKSGIPFVIIPSPVNEEAVKKEFSEIDTEGLAKKYVKKLAYEKAKAIEPYIKNGIIVAADTIAFCDKEKLEKPINRADAMRILNKISGSKHVAITGVCIINNGNMENFEETSWVTIDKFEKEKIKELVNNPNTYLYAGGYCIDDNVDGYAHVNPEDIDNVIGLPIKKIKMKLNLEGEKVNEKY